MHGTGLPKDLDASFEHERTPENTVTFEIRTGGRVLAARAERLPEGMTVAAAFRYAGWCDCGQRPTAGAVPRGRR